MKPSHLIGPHPEPGHCNQACPGWSLDRWDSDERQMGCGSHRFSAVNRWRFPELAQAIYCVHSMAT